MKPILPAFTSHILLFDIRIQLMYSQTLHKFEALNFNFCLSEICCAEKLIHDLKKGAEKDFAFRIPSSHFFQDYDRLAKEFVAIGDTALYLQDMNYLTSIYRRFRNDELVERMNSTLKELEKCEASHLNFVLRGNEIYLQGSSDSLEHGKQELETGIDSCQ